MLARYMLFAVVATAANLAVQEGVVRATPVAALPLSILAGTIGGFLLKYLLDKRYVFRDGYTGGRDEIRKIGLYGLFSVATTLLFWSVEVACWMIWQTTAAKYAGATVGLAAGYGAKLALDRAFVFWARPT